MQNGEWRNASRATRLHLEMEHTYIYRGDDNERAPRNVSNINYVSNITKIKKRGMDRCCAITSVIHPDSIIIIEDEAYRWCDSIANLRLSSSLQTIGKLSFSACRSITVLELPATLHTIKKWGFRACESLRSIVPQQQNKPLSLKSIQDLAFDGCDALTSIPYFPKLEIIGFGTFRKCYSLTEVTVEI